MEPDIELPVWFYSFQVRPWADGAGHSALQIFKNKLTKVQKEEGTAVPRTDVSLHYLETIGHDWCKCMDEAAHLFTVLQTMPRWFDEGSDAKTVYEADAESRGVRAEVPGRAVCIGFIEYWVHRVSVEPSETATVKDFQTLVYETIVSDAYAQAQVENVDNEAGGGAVAEVEAAAD